MKYQELLKASKGLPAKDPIAALWGLNLAGTGWDITEITGTLPLAFTSRAASSLKNYRIYGTAEGTGEETESGEPTGYKLPLTVESGAQSQDIPIYIGSSKLGEEEYVDFGEQKVYKRTENLWSWENKTINQDTSFITKEYTLKPNTTYTMSSEAPLYNNGALIAFGIPGESASTSTNGVYQDHPITRTTGADGKVFIGLRTNNSSYDLTQFKTCLTESSTPPETYIPYLQPTDPPVPLPPIPTYKGEDTLSSTETLGEVTVKGRIREVTT